MSKQLNEIPEAIYIRTEKVTRYDNIYLVTCPKCKNQFETKRFGTLNVSAIPCKYCTCAFNVEWLPKTN